MKDSFVFYKSFYDAIKQIPEEYQLELYNAILQYSLEGIEPQNLSNITSAMFTLIKPNIDSSQKKYETSVENGKKGGRPKKPNKNPTETQTKPNKNLTETQQKPKQNLNDNVNVDDNDNVNDNDNVDVDVVLEEQLQKRFIECIGSTNLNSINECVSYLNDLPYEVIEKALEKTSRSNTPNWKYAKIILDDWLIKKIDTVEKVEIEEQKFKQKTTTPKQNNVKQFNYPQRNYVKTDFDKFYANKGG